jgi:hypothetical protein
MSDVFQKEASATTDENKRTSLGRGIVEIMKQTPDFPPIQIDQKFYNADAQKIIRKNEKLRNENTR